MSVKNIFLKKYIPFLIFLFFIQNIKSQITDCLRQNPILISGECQLNYCSKSQFNSSYCIIANPIVKTQWLNNIITFGNSDFRYVNFGIFSNGDMVVETSAFPKSRTRMFYGLKQNGRPLYEKEGKETSYYSVESDNTGGMFESEGSTIKLVNTLDPLNNGKEYYINIGKYENNVEVFDFDKNKVYYKTLSAFTSTTVTSFRHAFLPITTTLEKYYYLFGFIGSDKIYFQKHNFNSITNFASNITYDLTFKTVNNPFGRQVSCFQTTQQLLIICFYLTKKDNIVKFIFHKFDKNLLNEKTSYYQSNIDDESLFCKCVHLKDEVGIFASYYPFNNINYPFLLVREFANNNFKDYLSIQHSAIILQKPNLKINVLLNDIVKMNDNKIVFTSTNKEILYIALINFFGVKQYKIRYYIIPLYDLYHYKILSELRINNYNNFLVFASSFCPIKECNNDDNEHYSGLIIFSYPNSKDYTLNLDEYLFNNNNITITRIEIDLKEQLNLENNIFGYVLSNITITEIGSESNFKLYSSNEESLEITNNYVLEKDENIILKYIGNLEHVETIEKIIKYYFIATEPELNIYDSYTEETKGDNDENYFKKEEYIGRLNYYTIKLENELSNDCPDSNCDFCHKLMKTTCITCKDQFLISENIKTCYNSKAIETTIIQMTDLITVKETEINTERITDKLTEKATELKTEKMTEKVTETFTEEITEVTTESITEKITEEKTENIQKKTDKITEELKSEKECSKADIINNECSTGLMTEEQIGQLYNQLKDNILTSDYKGENKIIKTENVIFQISTLDDQKNSDNPDVSSIDLGDCENELKKSSGIPEEMSLIVFKTDIKTEDLTQTFVQYEIYDPRNMNPLDLSICKDKKISVSTPVKLDSSTSSLYDDLKNSGYDLFNENDDFYTDICSIYTSSNGTDMTLADRKKEIYSTSGNKTLCQSGCELESYNSTNRKAKCECSPQINDTEPVLSSSNDKFSVKKIADNFFSTLTNSNFLVLKCYKLVINLKNIFTNIGRIFMTVILIISLISLIIFCFHESLKIDNYINTIKKFKLNSINNNKKIIKNNNIQNNINKNKNN